MSEPILFAAVFVTGVFAGALNTVAGGGSLLMLPVFMLLVGLPAPIANGTTRVAVLVQCLSAAATYRRGRIPGMALAIRLAPPVCIGSLGGAWLATQLAASPLERVMGVVFLVCAPVVVLTRSFGAKKEGPPRAPRQVHFVWVALVAFVVGLYSGFLQAAVGIPILLLLVMALGVDAVEANHVKVLVIAASMVVALAVFLPAGQVDLRYGAIAAAGQAIGALAGARLVIEKGLGVIRWTIAIAVAASALKMLGAFG